MSSEVKDAAALDERSGEPEEQKDKLAWVETLTLGERDVVAVLVADTLEVTSSVGVGNDEEESGWEAVGGALAVSVPSALCEANMEVVGQPEGVEERETDTEAVGIGEGEGAGVRVAPRGGDGVRVLLGKVEEDGEVLR